MGARQQAASALAAGEGAAIGGCAPVGLSDPQLKLSHASSVSPTSLRRGCASPRASLRTESSDDLYIGSETAAAHRQATREALRQSRRPPSQVPTLMRMRAAHNAPAAADGTGRRCCLLRLVASSCALLRLVAAYCATPSRPGVRGVDGEGKMNGGSGAAASRCCGEGSE